MTLRKRISAPIFSVAVPGDGRTVLFSIQRAGETTETFSTLHAASTSPLAGTDSDGIAGDAKYGYPCEQDRKDRRHVGLQ